MKIEELRKKWENLWYHYKLQILGIAFVVFCVGFTVVTEIGKVDPDIMISYVGNSTIPDMVEQRMNESFADEIQDVNNDGNKILMIKEMLFGVDELKTQPMYIQQFDLDVVGGESAFYIIDADMYELLKSREVFVPVEYNGESLDYIDISNNPLFTDGNFMFENKYLVKRTVVAGEEKQKHYAEKKEMTDKIIEKVLANR